MTSSETVLLELQLKEARERERATQRAAQVATLKNLRKELSTAAKEYDALARKLSKAVDGKDDLELEINHWRAALSALEQQAPQEIRVKELSDDPAVLEYMEQHHVLTAKLEKLCAKRPAFFHIAADRVTAVQLAQHIKALEFSERVLMRSLTGELDADHKDERGGSVRGVA